MCGLYAELMERKVVSITELEQMHAELLEHWGAGDVADDFDKLCKTCNDFLRGIGLAICGCTCRGEKYYALANKTKDALTTKHASSLVATYGVQAYETAAKSQVAAKSAETVSQVYTTVAANPAVVTVATKTSEAADQLRAKLAEKLVEIKRGNGAASPEIANGV